jgi:pilus assembly protein CpaB
MNKRLLGVLLFAFVVSAGASVVLYRLMASRLTAQAGPSGTLLCVAARNLPIGTLIRNLDVRTVQWTGNIPAQAVQKEEDIVGRGVIADIYEGEPFLGSRLAAKGAGAGLAAIIPPGMRAVAVRVNDVTSLAGYVTPGMRVDVLILGTPPNGSQLLGTQTKTLLQNIEILSAGQQIQKDAEGKPISVPVVNVLVTPEQAEMLSLASQDARIQLVLRNPLDTKEAQPPGTAMARLWSGQAGLLPPPPVRAPRPPVAPRQVEARPEPKVEKITVPIIVEIIHGGRGGAKKEEKKFKGKEESEEP